MAGRKNSKRKLTAVDFCGEGEPYSEVVVKISIRILGAEIARSRMAVNVYPDPALEKMAREELREKGVENYGLNEDGVFGTCLSENSNGWEDMNKTYPLIDERHGDSYLRDCAKRMNEYMGMSVNWALDLNKRGMKEAGVKGGATLGGDDLVM
jgi:hypothetical protein